MVDLILQVFNYHKILLCNNIGNKKNSVIGSVIGSDAGVNQIFTMDPKYQQASYALKCVNCF